MNLENLTTLTRTELLALQQALPTMSLKEKMELMDLLEVREQRAKLAVASHSVLGFANAVYPGFKVGPHHRKLAKLFTEVIEGKKKRVIINIAPRMGKSEFSSYLFPAYFLGKFPEKKIIMGTHTAGLSEDFGRRIRNLLHSDEYHEVFPKTFVADDQKAAGKWSTSAGGQYYAAGVGGALAGRGADLFVIDDPHSEQDVKNNSRLAFDTAWSWFQTGPLQRLMPGGAIIVIMCMVGNTRVRMADGTEKYLRDIRPGDTVATYENGKLTTSKINNWRSNGVDFVYKVRTKSGIILQANARHPFLVEQDGERKWVRLQDLRKGFLLVSLKSAVDRSDLPLVKGMAYATPAKQEKRTIRNTLMHHISHCTPTVGGLVKNVRTTGVSHQQRQKDFASITTSGSAGLQAIALSHIPLTVGGTYGLSLGTGLRKLILTSYSKIKAVFVQFAGFLPPQVIPAHTGTTSSASITTTQRDKSEGYCATTVTSPLGMQKPQRSQPLLPPISEFITDEIVEILPCGQEEVFDVEVDRTENFIANGVVSHNTRWSLLDLTGRLIDYQIKNPHSPTWEIVELPAILNDGQDDEKSLWPEQWPLDTLKSAKASMEPRYWNAQYMQKPTSDTSAIISRKAWRIWPNEEPPKVEYVIQSWDTAFETHNSADYSACTTWGVWYNEEDGNAPCLILLDAFKDRMDFPELKRVALKHYKEWQPDSIIVEKKAAGAPLIQEMRAMGIPMSEFTPSRGNDKIVRLNAVADLFVSGKVWAPDTRWAREVIEEVASFPAGTHDDYVDTVSQALLRYRQGGFISLDSDEKDEPSIFRSRSQAYY